MLSVVSLDALWHSIERQRRHLRPNLRSRRPATQRLN